MSRRYINQYGERENVDDVFLASEKQLRSNRNGNLYLQVRLADRTGSLTAMLWNANEGMYKAFDNGDFLRVQGTTQYHNGTLQLIINRFDRAEPKLVDENDFITVGPAEITRLVKKVEQQLRGIRNAHLRRLAERFLADVTFMERFAAAPAGVKNHHAFKGGLLQHVASLMDACQAIAPLYPGLDADLLLIGAFLHDSGKIDELTYDRELGYSDEGQLIGHVVLAVGYVDQKAQEVIRMGGEALPTELLLRVKHMIVSHHGEYEYGSPKLPMTLEAIALHLLDNLDAKLYSVGQIIAEDANTDSPWTTFHAPLQRKFFKGDKS
jgi:3'-5' exoribonuclease